MDIDREIQRVQERNALRSVSGAITDKERNELRDLYARRDRDLAQALLDGAERYHAEDDDIPMLEAEGAIIERLGIDGNETEQGLTRAAVERIEKFVSDSLGRPWTYEDSGLLGAVAADPHDREAWPHKPGSEKTCDACADSHVAR